MKFYADTGGSFENDIPDDLDRYDLHYPDGDKVSLMIKCEFCGRRNWLIFNKDNTVCKGCGAPL